MTLFTAVFVAVALPAPAHAAPPLSVSGYVWAHDPVAASYVAATGYEYNSTGGAVRISRSATGRYQVRFDGMGVRGGAAHVRPYGTTNGLCTIERWRQDGIDEVLDVRCFTAAGVPADLRFVANFTRRAPVAGDLAYLWAQDATVALETPYQPSASYRYDSTGTGSWVWRQSVGVYLMTIGAVDAHYPLDSDDGVYQISVYGTDPVRCEIHDENDETPTPISVHCFDTTGAPADARFVVTYAHGVDLLGTAPAQRANFYGFTDPVAGSWTYGWSNPGGAPTMTRFGPGWYRVSFPGLAVTFGHASAGARGTSGQFYCAVGWWSAGAVTVYCYDTVTHVAADTAIGVALTD